jgi:hypothetical protein
VTRIPLPFFPQTMVCDHFMHNLNADNENLPDKKSPNYERFWNLQMYLTLQIQDF